MLNEQEEAIIETSQDEIVEDEHYVFDETDINEGNDVAVDDVSTDENYEDKVSIDWSSVEFEDDKKRIPAITGNDLDRIINSGILGDMKEKEFVEMLNMARNIIRTKLKNEEIVDEELGLTQAQMDARTSLAHYQLLARETLASIKTKSNVLMATGFQTIREMLSLNYEFLSEKNIEKFNISEIVRKGFFANFVEFVFLNKEFGDLSNLFKNIFGNIHKIHTYCDNYYKSYTLLKKFFARSYKSPYIMANRKLSTLRERIYYFRTIIANLALDEEPEIFTEDSHSIHDPNSELSRNLDNLASTKMFTRHDLLHAEKIINATRLYYETREYFVKCGRSKDKKIRENFDNWLKNLYKTWSSVYDELYKKTGKNSEELRIMFGGLTKEEEQMEKEGKELPEREICDNIKLYDLFIKESLISEGCKIIEEIQANDFSIEELRSLFDYIHSIIFYAYIGEISLLFINYDPIELDEEDEAYMMGSLFARNQNDPAVFDETKDVEGDKKQTKEDIKTMKERIKSYYEKNKSISLETRSYIKNAFIDLMEISLLVMNVPNFENENNANKEAILKQIMGSFYMEDTVLNEFFKLINNSDAFDSLCVSISHYMQSMFEMLNVSFKDIFENGNIPDYSNYSMKVKPHTNKKLSKKERKKLKAKQQQTNLKSRKKS